MFDISLTFDRALNHKISKRHFISFSNSVIDIIVTSQLNYFCHCHVIEPFLSIYPNCFLVSLDLYAFQHSSLVLFLQ